MESAKKLAGSVKFGSVRKALVPLSGAVVPALAAAGAGAKAVFDMLKFEILRDFYQVISLFFSGLGEKLPDGFKEVFGRVSEGFNLCVSCWFASAKDYYARNAIGIAVAILIVKLLIGLICSIIFIRRYRKYDPDADNQGLDVKDLGDKARKQAKIYSLILTTLYLPIFRDTLQVFTCDTKYIGTVESIDIDTGEVTSIGDSEKCRAGAHLFATILVVLNLFFYLLPLPFVFRSIIQKHKPAEQLYDAEGNKIEGSKADLDSDYRLQLAKNTSPYKSLFNGYERDWAYYKVIVMVVKVILITPAVLLVRTNTIGQGKVDTDGETSQTSELDRFLQLQAILTLVVLLGYMLLSAKSRPFLDNSNDFLDLISRFCCFGTGVICLILVYAGKEGIFDILLNVLTAISTVSMIIVVIMNLPAVKKCWKNCKKRADWSPVRGNPKLDLITSTALDLNRERKLRIWHEFWDVLFAQDEDFRAPEDPKSAKKRNAKKDKGKYGDDPEEADRLYEADFTAIKPFYSGGSTPPYQQAFKGTVQERHEENKEIVATESFLSFESALQSACEMNTNPQYKNLRSDILRVMHELVGLDVYWNGKVDKKKKEDGQEAERQLVEGGCSTRFGKMYCIPFPFTCGLTFDSGKDLVIFSFNPIVSGVKRDPTEGLKQFQEFVKQNFYDKEIQRRKKVRTKLRALSGNQVSFFIKKKKNKTKHRQVSDGKGGRKTESYTVVVEFTFRRGQFGVAQTKGGKVTTWTNPETNEVIDVSAGFSPYIAYADGEGYDREGKHWTNESERISFSEFGGNDRYEYTDKLKRLLGEGQFTRPAGDNLDYSGNYKIHTENFDKIVNQFKVYRAHFMNEFAKKEKTLSYAFWYFVYNYDHIPREQLEYVLTNYEQNKCLKTMSVDNKGDLDVVFEKLKYFDSHPAVGYWMVVFHDFWIFNNTDCKPLQDPEIRAKFDPFNEKSIMYNPCDKDELIKTLEECDLTGSNGCCRKGWINSDMIDAIYSKIEEYKADGLAAPTAPGLTQDLYKNYAYSSHCYTDLKEGEFEVVYEEEDKDEKELEIEEEKEVEETHQEDHEDHEKENHDDETQDVVEDQDEP